MKPETWRHRYLRLLKIEVTVENEYIEIVAPLDVKALYELEKSNYVRGVIILNHIGTPVLARIFGPTLEGRIFSEDITDWMEEHSLWGRTKDFFKWLGGWLVGIATAIIIHYLTNG